MYTFIFLLGQKQIRTMLYIRGHYVLSDKVFISKKLHNASFLLEKYMH